MNNMRFFLRRLCKSPVTRLLARCSLVLVALTWASPVFCGPIHDAADKGDLEKVKALLKESPDLVSSKDSNSLTPLFKAAFSGHKHVVELLLANGAEVDPKDNSNGLTPLYVAARMAIRTW